MIQPIHKSYPSYTGYALILIALAIMIPVVLTQGILQSDPFFRWTFLLSIVWGGALCITLFLLMRRVEAYNDRLVISSWRGTEEIAYADIEWLFELVNRKGPAYLCVKYRDTTSQSDRIFLCIPKKDNASEESALAVFIRKQVMQARPAYSRDAEPSPWSVYGPLILGVLILYPLAKYLATSGY